MTIEQDLLRADLRASMDASVTGLPDYSVDPEVIGRVGNLIGETAGHEERKVRPGDSRGRFTDQDQSPDEHRSGGANIGLWTVSLCTSLCTVALLGVLAYWRLG
jgi:hypothetical protein